MQPKPSTWIVPSAGVQRWVADSHETNLAWDYVIPIFGFSPKFTSLWYHALFQWVIGTATDDCACSRYQRGLFPSIQLLTSCLVAETFLRIIRAALAARCVGKGNLPLTDGYRETALSTDLGLLGIDPFRQCGGSLCTCWHRRAGSEALAGTQRSANLLSLAAMLRARRGRNLSVWQVRPLGRDRTAGKLLVGRTFVWTPLLWFGTYIEHRDAFQSKRLFLCCCMSYM